MNKQVIYAKNGLWWKHEGTLEEAKKLPKTHGHRYFDGKFGSQTTRAHQRPNNFYKLSPQSQWDIDKQLGILDWSGEPNE